jgi:hypothetical protein
MEEVSITVKAKFNPVTLVLVLQTLQWIISLILGR